MTHQAYVHVGDGGTIEHPVEPGCGTSSSLGAGLIRAVERGDFPRVYCVDCEIHLPTEQFVWKDDGTVVGT